MTAEEYLNVAEESADKAFLQIAFNQVHQEYENDPDTDIPESLEDALENGWRELNERNIRHDARKERFKWHAKFCFDHILRRL